MNEVNEEEGKRTCLSKFRMRNEPGPQEKERCRSIIQSCVCPVVPYRTLRTTAAAVFGTF
jgi:hypothetical protein